MDHPATNIPFHRPQQDVPRTCAPASDFPASPRHLRCSQVIVLPTLDLQEKALELLANMTDALLRIPHNKSEAHNTFRNIYIRDFGLYKDQLQQLLMAEGILNPDGKESLMLELPDPTMLEGADLQGVNLEGVCLYTKEGQVSFKDTNLTWARLMDATLQDACFDGADLSHAQAWYADFQGSSFKRAQLVDTGLFGAQLQHTQLERANLESADLCGANLSEAMGLKRAQWSQAEYNPRTVFPHYFRPNRYPLKTAYNQLGFILASLIHRTESPRSLEFSH